MLRLELDVRNSEKASKLSNCFFLYFDFRAIIKFCFAQTVFKYFPIIKFAKRQIMNTIAVVASWHCCVQNISTFCYIQKSLGTPLFCSI